MDARAPPATKDLIEASSKRARSERARRATSSESVSRYRYAADRLTSLGLGSDKVEGLLRKPHDAPVRLHERARDGGVDVVRVDREGCDVGLERLQDLG